MNGDERRLGGLVGCLVIGAILVIAGPGILFSAALFWGSEIAPELFPPAVPARCQTDAFYDRHQADCEFQLEDCETLPFGPPSGQTVAQAQAQCRRAWVPANRTPPAVIVTPDPSDTP